VLTGAPSLARAEAAAGGAPAKPAKPAQTTKASVPPKPSKGPAASEKAIGKGAAKGAEKGASPATVPQKAAEKGEKTASEPAPSDPNHVLTRDEVRRRLKGAKFLEVRARDISMTERSLHRLIAIAKRYHEATHKHLVVTGGTRDAERQAELMCAKLDHHDDILALYENKHLAREVTEAYEEAQKAHLSHGRTVKTIRERIQAQVARGEFISRHLLSGAADVRSRGMSPSDQQAFRHAVGEEPGASVLDERDGAAPHFHVNL
jgi:hypothetical protein